MRDYEKFRKIYDEIEDLLQKNVTNEDPEFIAWHTKVDRFIRNYYGDGPEFKDFTDAEFGLMVWTSYTTHNDAVQACREGLIATRAKFGVYLDEMEDTDSLEKLKSENIDCLKNEDYSRVFIVHGHNGVIKESVARLVEKQGITPIILHEQANRGQTIIEKIESNADVNGAICLFTADDEGKSKKENDYKQRARQNVVFEAGYFIGKFGRNKVMLIADKDIEIPSDLSGVVYSDSGHWKFSVLQELKAMGYNIDYNKID